MSIEFKKLTIESYNEIIGFFKSNRVESCEYDFVTLFLWNELYKTDYYVTENYLLFLNKYKDEIYTMMPLCMNNSCKKEAFDLIWNYFKNELNIKLSMYVVNEEYANLVKYYYGDVFEIVEDRDAFDYIYDANELRSLKGKKFNQKRNHINAFIKENAGEFIYKSIEKDSIDEVVKFLIKWNEYEKISDEHIKYEASGIEKLIKYKDFMDFKIGGIWIKDELEAFSIGSYSDTNEEQVIIHIEKANSSIRGLYPMICQQFLIHEFKNAVTVNREDDLGIEGLRKSKLSYQPIRLAKKYHIFER